MPTIRINPDFEPLKYEKLYWSMNKFVCGVDEVGRGCFAGPVVAAAVILKPNVKHDLIRDSKVLSEKQRIIACQWIKNNSYWALGFADHHVINKINIYNATLIAMKRAVIQLLSSSYLSPSLILVDHMPLVIKDIDMPIFHFSYGESLSSSVAAASIIAKVARDELMNRINKYIPGYKFDTNKGYGTEFHRDYIDQSGLLFIHRKKFVSHLSTIKKIVDKVI